MTDLELSASVEVQTPESVSIVYRVTNTAARPMLVCNQLWEQRTPEGQYVIDPNVAYTSFEPGPLAVVAKQVVDRGDEVNVEQPMQPCASLLAPGDSVTERIVLRLPLRARDPYRPSRADVAAQPSRGLAVCIGWMWRDEIDDVLVPEVATTAGALPLVKASADVQHLARVDLGASIPVLAPPMPGGPRNCPACGSVNVTEYATCLRCGAALPETSVAPAGPDWRPTHRVPAGGLSGYDAPGATASVELDAGLPVQVVERQGDWARVVLWTGWTGWVDGRGLEPAG